MTTAYTSTPLPAAPDALALLEDWEVHLLMVARRVKLQSERIKRPIMIVVRFDVGVMFLDPTTGTGGRVSTVKKYRPE